MAEVRQRNVTKPTPADDPIADDLAAKIRRDDGNNKSISLLDVLRMLVGFALLNAALSYYVTGSKFTWGLQPWFADPKQVQAWLVCRPLLLSSISSLTVSRMDQYA